MYTGYALDGLGQRPNDDEKLHRCPILDAITHPALAARGGVDASRQHVPMASLTKINTRVALKKVLAEAASLGFGFNLGIECEVFVVKLDEQGRLHIPNPDDNLVKSCYDVKLFLDRFGWLDKMALDDQRARLGSLQP